MHNDSHDDPKSCACVLEDDICVCWLLPARFVNICLKRKLLPNIVCSFWNFWSINCPGKHLETSDKHNLPYMSVINRLGIFHPPSASAHSPAEMEPVTPSNPSDPTTSVVINKDHTMQPTGSEVSLQPENVIRAKSFRLAQCLSPQASLPVNRMPQIHLQTVVAAHRTTVRVAI